MTEQSVPLLPPTAELETRAVLRQLSRAHRYLAELKGLTASIPNEHILIDTLALQGAKDSSDVENIVTTHDDLYRVSLFADYVRNPATKEVYRYAVALRTGFDKMRGDRLLTVNRIINTTT